MAVAFRRLFLKTFTVYSARGFFILQTNNVRPLLLQQTAFRPISVSAKWLAEKNERSDLEASELEEVDPNLDPDSSEKDDMKYVKNARGVGRITVKKVDVETSIRYMESAAYKRTYGDEPIWKPYRRNFRGKRPSVKTRKQCIRGGHLCGNACPICRDEYLVIHYSNSKLLEQFKDPITGQILPTNRTGVCQKQHKMLCAALLQAYDHGYIEMEVPFRRYQYKSYYPQLQLAKPDLETWRRQITDSYGSDEQRTDQSGSEKVETQSDVSSKV